MAILRQSGGSASRSPLSEAFTANAESYDGLVTGGTLQRVPRPQYTHRLNTCVNAKETHHVRILWDPKLTATMAAAEPNITLYQLNCEKLAAETFRRETADEDRVDYRAHYNAHLNKCFYAETYIARTPVGKNIWVYLSDLQQNRIYGGFHRSTNIGLFYCSLQDKECHSEAEWNELVKPYMED